MQPASSPPVTFEVRVGTHGGPELRVQAGDRDIPIAMLPDQAATLGVALISASAIFRSGEPLPKAGDTVEGTNLPVVGWKAGANLISGLPALQITVLGGASLVLQFTKDGVVACARILRALARGAGVKNEAG